MRDTPSILPLSVENLSFEAGGKTLLDRVCFSLPRGGITALVGPNGSGKSLTLRLCHGLLAPSSGEVAWATPDGGSGRKRHAMVFQKPVMLRRSARGNILHALAAIGAGRRERTERCDAALTRFGLAELAARPARLMSGGEQQRLAIARAVVNRPALLIADEPTANLDAESAARILDIFVAFHQVGVTVLIATHDLGLVQRYGKRVLRLADGRVA
jgi:tungstate transport system ATP-binding protein